MIDVDFVPTRIVTEFGKVAEADVGAVCWGHERVDGSSADHRYHSVNTD
jgi:hypothetical protein